MILILLRQSLVSGVVLVLLLLLLPVDEWFFEVAVDTIFSIQSEKS